MLPTNVRFLGIALSAFCAASCCLAAPARLILAGDQVLAIHPEDGVLWRLSLGDTAWLEAAPSAGRFWLLSNGVLINAEGRIVGRFVDSRTAGDWPFVPDIPTAKWDVPTEITPPPPAQTSDAHQPPMFDSAGDAWVINTHLASGQYSLQVRRSQGHSGVWGPMETISNTTRYVAGPEAVIDTNDNITVAFRDIAGGYHLYAIRYQPATGWGPLTRVHTSSSFFQAIEIGADAAGTVTAVFDPDVVGSSSVWSVSYDPASGVWGPAGQVSPAGWTTILPTVFCNPAANAMYLVYLVRSGGPPGIYGHIWDAHTRQWGPATLLPGTEPAGYSGVGPVSRFPGVVDSAGNLTFFWGTPYVPHATRCTGGVWQPAVQLMPATVVDVENFGGAAARTSGEVFGAFSRFESGTVRFFYFKYEPGVGWLEPQNPYTVPLNLATRTRVSFYQGPRAVGTMLGVQGGVRQVTSRLYDKGTWAPDILDIPGHDDAFYADLAADQGEVLLVYEGEIAGVNQGIKATFLRDPHAGDVNCDGAINFADINPFVLRLTNPAGYQSAFPDCDPLNGDIDGDGVVNFGDINPFIRLLTQP